MVEFVCMTCGRTIKKDEMGRRTRCPYCGGKIILKKRPKIVKTVKAI